MSRKVRDLISLSFIYVDIAEYPREKISAIKNAIFIEPLDITKYVKKAASATKGPLEP